MKLAKENLALVNERNVIRYFLKIAGDMGGHQDRMVKSTTIKAALNLIKRDEGKVTFWGQDLSLSEGFCLRFCAFFILLLDRR